MALNSHQEAINFIRDSVHLHTAQEIGHGTKPDDIIDGVTFASQGIGDLRYLRICALVEQDLRTQRPHFGYPEGYLQARQPEIISLFIYHTANLIFPHP